MVVPLRTAHSLSVVTVSGVLAASQSVGGLGGGVDPPGPLWCEGGQRREEWTWL